MALPKKKLFSDYDNYVTEEDFTTAAEAQEYFRNIDELVEAVIDSGYWQPETKYSKGDVVVSPAMPSGAEAVCVAENGGLSSGVEPSWGEVGGANVSDGTCFWKLRWKHWTEENATTRLPNATYVANDVMLHKSNLSVALKCIQGGITSAEEFNLGGVTVGTTIEDGEVVWEVVKRDLTAEVNANAKNFANYLPVDGSGNMRAPIDTTAVVGMRKMTNAESLEFNGGKSYENGAYLILLGSEYSDDSLKGSFALGAVKDGTFFRLRGYPDGKLTWNGYQVITTNEVQQGRGLEYLIAPRQIRRITITYKKPLKTAVYPKCWLAGNLDYHYDPIVIRTTNVTTTGFTIVLSNAVEGANYYVDFYWEVIGEVAM